MKNLSRILIAFIGLSFIHLSVGLMSSSANYKRPVLKCDLHIQEDSIPTVIDVPNDTILSHEVRATFYNPVPSQTDGSPDKTATGFKIDVDDPYKHRIIAISRDLEHLGYAMGDSVHLYFSTDKSLIYDGVYIIQDRMHKKHTMKIDLLVAPDMYMSYINGVKIIKLNSNN